MGFSYGLKNKFCSGICEPLHILYAEALAVPHTNKNKHTHGWENPIHCPWRENYIRRCVCVNYGRALHLNAQQTALDAGKRHLIWREVKGTRIDGRQQHYLSGGFLFICSGCADESMCRNPAHRLCSLSDELLSCGSASPVPAARTEPLQIQKFAFDQGYLTQIGLHSQQLAIQPMIYSCGRQKRKRPSLSLHPLLSYLSLWEIWDARNSRSELNHFDIANAPSWFAIFRADESLSNHKPQPLTWQRLFSSYCRCYFARRHKFQCAICDATCALNNAPSEVI